VTATTPPPLPADLNEGLKRLKMAAMRRLAPELLVTAKTQRWKPEEFLRTLVEAEIASRDQSNVRTRPRFQASSTTIKYWEYARRADGRASRWNDTCSRVLSPRSRPFSWHGGLRPRESHPGAQIVLKVVHPANVSGIVRCWLRRRGVVAARFSSRNGVEVQVLASTLCMPRLEPSSRQDHFADTDRRCGPESHDRTWPAFPPPIGVQEKSVRICWSAGSCFRSGRRRERRRHGASFRRPVQRQRCVPRNHPLDCAGDGARPRSFSTSGPPTCQQSQEPVTGASVCCASTRMRWVVQGTAWL